MLFKSQAEQLDQLQQLANSKRQSIVIEGLPGSGKTYLAQQYANMLYCDDFAIIQPKVADVREALDSFARLTNMIVVCIENLDLGVAAAAYTLLKTLEEPQPNVFIVVTCRNANMIPDTIISRCAVVTTAPPRLEDIDLYGKTKNEVRFNEVVNRLAWRCVRSFTEADEVLKMNSDQLSYYESLGALCKFTDSISNLSWKVAHYESGQECNLDLAIRSIMELVHTPFATKCGIDCIRDLSKGRIAKHAVLSKFLFNLKYCE